MFKQAILCSAQGDIFGGQANRYRERSFVDQLSTQFERAGARGVHRVGRCQHARRLERVCTVNDHADTLHLFAGLVRQWPGKGQMALAGVLCATKSSSASAPRCLASDLQAAQATMAASPKKIDIN
jgi:hypothetical protein